MPLLPPGAMQESYRRLRLASELGEQCPPGLWEEIAVTGSVALGVADAASDLELNLWSDTLPSLGERAAWLERVGATDIRQLAEPLAAFTYKDAAVEVGWQASSALDGLLTTIHAGDVLGHGRLVVAWVVANAVPVCSTGRLAAWQRRLATYPDRLQQQLIEANTRVFQDLHAMQGRWTYCRCGQHLALTERLLWSTYNVLRLLFALNRQWEPDWKWLRHVPRNLASKPDQLVERIDLTFLAPTLEERVRANHELILDTLLLLPSSPDVERAQRVIQSTLQTVQGSG